MYRRIETVVGDERQIYVAIAVAETAVGDAADEVGANEPFAELRSIQWRERMSKGERGSSSHLVFTVIAFSGHDLPVTGRSERIHPKQIFYLHDVPGAFLARELSRTGSVDNLEFRIKHDATNGTRAILFARVRHSHRVL